MNIKIPHFPMFAPIKWNFLFCIRLESFLSLCTTTNRYFHCSWVEYHSLPQLQLPFHISKLVILCFQMPLPWAVLDVATAYRPLGKCQLYLILSLITRFQWTVEILLPIQDLVLLIDPSQVDNLLRNVPLPICCVDVNAFHHQLANLNSFYFIR